MLFHIIRPKANADVPLSLGLIQSRFLMLFLARVCARVPARVACIRRRFRPMNLPGARHLHSWHVTDPAAFRKYTLSFDWPSTLTYRVG